MDETILAAQTALGKGASGDYKIQPSRHAAELAATAPGLSSLLRRSELAVLAEQYEQKDELANRNQAIFETTANRANWAVLLTACFSTLLLIAGPMKSPAGGVSVSKILALIGVCGVICGALGSMWVYRAREGKLLDNWMSARAAAESLRKRYFETVTGLTAPDINAPINLALLQFEYFRRYQLDVQIEYFQRRAGDHRRDADRFLSVSAVAVALASMSAGVAAVLSMMNPSWVAIAALGTVATALAAFASTRESVNQSRQNADRYTNTCDALTLLKGKMDAVRAAAAVGEHEPMAQFVAAAHEQINAEHRQWLAAAQNIQPALDKLQETLAKLKQKEPDSKATAGS